MTSMRALKRVLLFALPLIVVPVISVTYTRLNIDQRLFVERFGCGCAPFFNTNHLSLGVCGLLTAGSASCWWVGGRDLSRSWLLAIIALFAGGIELLARYFLLNNLWL